MYSFRLFEQTQGVGYVIAQDECVIINQPFDPDRPGEAPMDTTRATEAAQTVIARLRLEDEQPLVQSG